jgi:hypothetical protein
MQILLTKRGVFVLMLIVFWVLGGILFALATIIFYLFPRTIAAISILTLLVGALFFGNQDLANVLNIPSISGSGKGIDMLAILITAAFYLWVVGGLVADVATAKDLLRRLSTRD